MDATLRPGRPEDANPCGAICYEAFKAIASQHNFPPDFPSREAAVELLSMLLAHPGFYAVVAEAEGRIVGRTSWTSAPRLPGSAPSRSNPPCRTAGSVDA